MFHVLSWQCGNLEIMHSAETLESAAAWGVRNDQVAIATDDGRAWTRPPSGVPGMHPCIRASRFEVVDPLDPRERIAARAVAVVRARTGA